LIGLIGPNGSGKSTFLNVLSGFLTPDAGAISFRGEDVTAWRVDELARAGIGRTFQVPQLIDQLTTIENIEIGLVGREKGGLAAALLRLPVDLKRNRLRREAALATFRAMRFVPESLGRPVAELSLGFKRIVEIGRAAVSAPTILLLDEPAAGLNDSERQDLGDRLKEIAARGITILVVEHNVPFVLRVCDSLLLLENGQVTCRADLKERLPASLEAYLRHDPTPTPVRAAS
jgi:ABC-type branched-subunit amino acid transport system ATPase component